MGNIVTIGDDGGDDLQHDEGDAQHMIGVHPVDEYGLQPLPYPQNGGVNNSDWQQQQQHSLTPATPTRQGSWGRSAGSDGGGFHSAAPYVAESAKWPSFPHQGNSALPHQSSSSGGWPASASQDPWAELPLHHAAATGAPSAELNRLVAHEGQDVDAQDASGSTPLHLACYFGHEHCALWLMNRGRARFILDADGNTPADVARQNGHIKLAEALEERMGDAVKSNRWRRGLAAGHDRREEQLFVEVSRLQSENARLRASEKRARQELEAEVAERIKLFRRLVGGSTQQQQNGEGVDLKEIIADVRLQAAAFKAQRDALHAELRLVEDVLGDLETLLGTNATTTPDANSSANNQSAESILSEGFVSPSARLKSCLRRI